MMTYSKEVMSWYAKFLSYKNSHENDDLWLTRDRVLASTGLSLVQFIYCYSRQSLLHDQWKREQATLEVDKRAKTSRRRKGKRS